MSKTGDRDRELLASAGRTTRRVEGREPRAVRSSHDGSGSRGGDQTTRKLPGGDEFGSQRTEFVPVDQGGALGVPARDEPRGSGRGADVPTGDSPAIREDATVLFRPKQGGQDARVADQDVGKASAEEKRARGSIPEPWTGGISTDAAGDPPVGWLVAIEGPDKGSVATLGLGRNTVGRSRENRVPLGASDKQISRVNHCEIVYVAQTRLFYIQDRNSRNLTYVDDQPVLSSQILGSRAQVRMGDTVLRFVPFCDDEFSW